MFAWRWDVDDSGHLAAFEVTTSKAEEELGQATATEFASALDRAGVKTVTTMLRTRHQPGQVTVLWTGEISDPAVTRSVFQAYERALSDAPAQLG